MSYGNHKSIRDAVLAAACNAPSDAVMTACIRRIGRDAPESIPGTGLAKAAGRIDGAEGRRLWKRTKCSAAQATLVAATCGDPDLLTEMAEREKRQGALGALCSNPHLPLPALVRASKKVSHYSSSETAPRNVARRRMETEELDEVTIAGCMEADAALTITALAGRADLTPGQARELLQGEDWTYAVTPISHRADLPDLGSDVIGLLFRQQSYVDTIALATHPRLLEMGEEVLERLIGSQARTQLAARTDLPPNVRELVVVAAERNPDLGTWRAIMANETFDRDVLGRASCNLYGGDILGAVLAHRFGDDPESWETALGLFETFLGKPIDELVDTVEALRGQA